MFCHRSHDSSQSQIGAFCELLEIIVQGELPGNKFMTIFLFSMVKITKINL